MNNPAIFDALRAMVDSLGLDYGDVAAAFSEAVSEHSSTAPTVSEFIERVLPTLGAGTARGYKTHFERLRDGVARQCACTCDTCLDAFKNSGACACTCSRCSSAIEFPACGDKLLKDSNFVRTDLDRLAILAQRMSTKHAHLDNRGRARRGLPLKFVHGQGGQEMCVSALRCLFGRGVDDGLLVANPAAKLQKGTRSETKRRALSVDELAEVLDVVASGGDDADLDLALMWLLIETAGRRAGIEHLTMGSIQIAAQSITLHEKGNKVRSQPVSAELIGYLLALAEVRGGRRCVPGSDEFDPSAPLLYLSGSAPDGNRPMGRKRFETLFGRIQASLPWAAEAQVTAHSMRHTTATLVERLCNYQVAKRYLGHSSHSPTDAYTKATDVETATAMSLITGFAHPKATN
jgi:integrase